ncbi:MAG: hypothetical protein HY692_02175, partial [Cyanobacteria bacterium NC_groundwater_1444_Ag_S-0.65um_54_12]|nr:hypothetical protein [Cyanobacteria bacterium NC_groundwater_1444_Ag_S-0.65um_54_12]
MPPDCSQRKKALDWLVTGQEALVQAFLSEIPVSDRLDDPWLLLIEGECYRHLRHYPEAAFCLEKALEHFEQRGIQAGSFAACGDLMGLAWERQNLEAFQQWSDRAAKNLPAGTAFDQAEYYNNLACHELRSGQQAAAAKLWEKVLDLPQFQSLHIASIKQFATLNLGVLALEHGDLAIAERRFSKVLALTEKQELRPSVRYGALLYLARITFQRGELAAAQAMIATLPEAGDPYRKAEAHQLQAEISLAESNLPDAERAIH